MFENTPGNTTVVGYVAPGGTIFFAEDGSFTSQAFDQRFQLDLATGSLLIRASVANPALSSLTSPILGAYASLSTKGTSLLEVVSKYVPTTAPETTSANTVAEPGSATSSLLVSIPATLSNITVSATTTSALIAKPLTETAIYYVVLGSGMAVAFCLFIACLLKRSRRDSAKKA